MESTSNGAVGRGLLGSGTEGAPLPGSPHRALYLGVQTFIDTSGWAFSFPLARLAGARVLAYVHYPTISTDMLSRVWTGDAMCAPPSQSNSARSVRSAWSDIRDCSGHPSVF